MKLRNIKLILFMVFWLVYLPAFTQPGGGPPWPGPFPGNGPGPPWSQPGLPINTHNIYLVTLGVLYGIYLKKRKK